MLYASVALEERIIIILINNLYGFTATSIINQSNSNILLSSNINIKGKPGKV
jgi:hypothetical protein